MISMVTFQRQHVLLKNVPHDDTEVPVQSQLKNIDIKGYSCFILLEFLCKNLGQGPIILHKAGHVEAASCEHGKSAEVPEHEESFVHGIDSRTIFIF